MSPPAKAMRPSVVALLLLAACDSSSKGPEFPELGQPQYDRERVSELPGPDLCTDRDGDGVFASCRDTALTAVDCDDLDGERAPGRPEVCNGKDDDCNGQVDDGTGTRLCPLSCAMPAAGCEALTKLAAGDNHACALTDQGHVVCWGVPGASMLPLMVDRSWKFVPGIEGAEDIAAEGSRTCVRKGTAAICWDAITLIPTTFKIAFQPPSYPPFEEPEKPQFDLTREALCVNDNGIKCWLFAEGPVPPYADSVTDYNSYGMDIRAGGSTVCIPSSSRVQCASTKGDELEWSNSATIAAEGLTVGDRVCSLGPVGTGVTCNSAMGGVTTVVGTEQAVEVSAGLGIECGRTAGGRVWCWVGPDPAESTVFTQIVTGKNFGCGITAQSDVECWGNLTGNPLAWAETYQEGPVLNTSEGPHGGCDNPADLKELWSSPLADDLESCAMQCEGSPSATCGQQCLVRARPLTAQCAACVVTWGQCQGTEAACQAALVSCAGFDAIHYTSRTEHDEV